MRKLSWLLLPVLVASCSFIFGAPTQTITITTASGKPASCVLKNNLGQWQATSGQPVEIKTSAADLKIKCAAKNLHAFKDIKPDNSAYPASVMVTLKPRKHSDADPSATTENENTQGDDEIESQPLNTLPDDGDGSDNGDAAPH